MSPEGASHFITDYCLTGAMGNGEWRKIRVSGLAGQGTSGNVHLGSANAPSPAMECTMDPGKMYSKLKERVAATIKVLPPCKLYL